MTRRKKEIKSFGKYLILISSITLLNFMGISYASWNDGLEINTSVSTGKIAPIFCNNVSIDKKNGEGDLLVHFDDKYTMDIQGKVSPGYKAFLHYCVINDGSIPVKYVGHPQNIPDGLKLQLNQQSGILEPQDRFYSETGNPKLHIKAEKKGTYEFEIELPFSQWIKS